MNTKKAWAIGMAAALLFAAAPFIQGCEPAENTTVAETADHGHEHTEGEEHAHMEESADDHGHEHAEGEDHAHDDMAMEHEHDDDHGHEHAEGDDHAHVAMAEDEEPTTVDGWMHAIAAKHTILETADTDEALLDAHHVPFEIEEMFTKLRPMLELSEADAAKYDELHSKIGQAAELIEKHSHEEDVAMVRTVLDKLNADIEALEKVAAPDHVH